MYDVEFVEMLRKVSELIHLKLRTLTGNLKHLYKQK